jgi:hypothetical protein
VLLLPLSGDRVLVTEDEVDWRLGGSITGGSDDRRMEQGHEKGKVISTEVWRMGRRGEIKTRKKSRGAEGKKSRTERGG